MALHAKQHALADLPPEVLIYLLGSRYCETDRLTDVAWSMFGHLPAGWARVQAVCDFVHNHITFGYHHADRAKCRRGTSTTSGQAFAATSRTWPITLCRCLNIPARYCTGYLGDIGVPPTPGGGGFRRLVAGLSRRRRGTPSIRATTCRASAAS